MCKSSASGFHHRTRRTRFGGRSTAMMRCIEDMKSDMQFLECVQASSLVFITTNVGQYADVTLSEEGIVECAVVISTRNGSSDSKYAAQESLCILHGTRRDDHPMRGSFMIVAIIFDKLVSLRRVQRPSLSCESTCRDRVLPTYVGYLGTCLDRSEH